MNEPSLSLFNFLPLTSKLGILLKLLFDKHHWLPYCPNWGTSFLKVVQLRMPWLATSLAFEKCPSLSLWDRMSSHSIIRINCYCFCISTLCCLKSVQHFLILQSITFSHWQLAVCPSELWNPSGSSIPWPPCALQSFTVLRVAGTHQWGLPYNTSLVLLAGPWSFYFSFAGGTLLPDPWGKESSVGLSLTLLSWGILDSPIRHLDEPLLQVSNRMSWSQCHTFGSMCSDPWSKKSWSTPHC